MADDTSRRLRVRIANCEFEATGTDEWIDARYERFITDVRRLSASDRHLSSTGSEGDMADGQSGGAKEERRPSLAAFLRATVANGSQADRFLATAVWLERSGTSPLTTTVVAQALSEHRQKRLANPSDCLNRNVAKGYAIKTDRGFIVTSEGSARIVSAS